MKRLILVIGILSEVLNTRATDLSLVDSSHGIDFIKVVSWKEVLAKARRERKYIFVDCFATWCGPCKRMDREVYSQERVGDYFNEKFISVKVQMDSSKIDGPSTKSFYADARELRIRFGVMAYPTLLFLNSDGNILQSTVGAMPVDDLVRVGKDVVKPENDYYALLAEFRKGKRDMHQMSFLAQTAQRLLKDSSTARSIASEYFRLLRKDEWYSRRNIEFVHQFTNSSKDTGFLFFYQNSDTIDKIMRDENYSQVLIQFILFKEFALPEIRKSELAETIPDWNQISITLDRKYSLYYADRVTTGAMADWAKKHKQWDMYTKYLVRYLNRFGPKTDTGGHWEGVYLNSCAWKVFQFSKDSMELTEALHWSARAVIMDPQPENMDTYANLEYKLGRQEIALKWEGIAMKLLPDDKARAEPIRMNYQKMKNGDSTWEVYN